MIKITKSLTNSFIKSNIKPKKIWPEHSKSAEYEWIKNYSRVPWIDLQLNVPYKEILEEIKNNSKFLVDHRDDYGEHKGWKSFCIHGKGLTITQHTEDNRPYHWIKEVEENMPFTSEYFKSWNLNFQRLRVMALEPGGFVSVHQDRKKSALEPINIAITQPAGCDFVMEGWGVIPFEPGKAFMLDISNRHAVVNNSKETRYHIIVHCKELNDKFKKIIENCYI
jgi:hypothetical protein